MCFNLTIDEDEGNDVRDVQGFWTFGCSWPSSTWTLCLKQRKSITAGSSKIFIRRNYFGTRSNKTFSWCFLFLQRWKVCWCNTYYTRDCAIYFLLLIYLSVFVAMSSWLLSVTLYSVFCILLVVCYFYHKGVAPTFVVQLCSDMKVFLILLLITGSVRGDWLEQIHWDLSVYKNLTFYWLWHIGGVLESEHFKLMSGGKPSRKCGITTSGNHLFFSEDGLRMLETSDLDLSNARYSTNTPDASPWKMSFTPLEMFEMCMCPDQVYPVLPETGLR